MYFLRIEEAEQERMAELLANILELNDIEIGRASCRERV